MSATIRILCVGSDEALLRTRCDVLGGAGYDARCTLYTEGERLLGTDHFDLIIVSAFLTDQEKHQIVALAGTTPTVVLRTLTFAPELFGLVEERLAKERARLNQSAAE